MVEPMDDANYKVLIERVNNSIDGQKKIEGKLDLIVQMQLTIAALQEQVRSLQSGQQRLFDKSDVVDKRFEEMREQEIMPLRDEMVGNRRSIRVASALGGVILTIMGGAYAQWKPWQGDVQGERDARESQFARYSQDVGKELQSNDRRLTVLEFRANNVDQRGSK